MKNLNLSKLLSCIAVALTTIVCIPACQKMPVADKENPYGVPNPPSTVGSTIVGNIYPLSGIPNTAVTLSGVNINPVAANNTITINGVPAPIESVVVTSLASYTIPKVTIVFTVPANATSGKIVLKTNGTETTWPTDFEVLTANVSTYANLGANYIEHLAFDQNGIAYGDNTDKVFKISQTGQVSTFVDGSGGKPFKFIWGVVANYFNEVFVPDALGNVIYRILENGKPGVYVGSGRGGVVDGLGTNIEFGAPRGIAKDVRGNLYVTDVHRVRKISTSGEVTTLAGSEKEGNVDAKGAAAQFGALDGITVDTAGNVYVSDRRYYNIRRIRPDGTVTTLAGSGSPGMVDGLGANASFTDPRSLAADKQGNIFVSDQNVTNSTYAVRTINKAGRVVTFIKGSSSTGVINGPVATASVNAPNGLAFGPDENLYIVNTGANVISKVTIK